MKKIEVKDHWASELQKLRCWISGWHAARKVPGVINLDHYIPGEDTLRQIVMAIGDAEEKKKKQRE